MGAASPGRDHAQEVADALDADGGGPPHDLHRGRAWRRRFAKGWKLTHPEALAIICDDMHEAARGGASYEAVMEAARTAVAASEVLDGVPEAFIGTVKIECLFGDGMRVLHVERPIGSAAPASAGGA